MMMSQLAFMHIFLHIICVIFCFWVLQSVNVSHWFKKGHSAQIILLLIVLSVLLGSALSNFIMDFFILIQEASLIFS